MNKEANKIHKYELNGMYLLLDVNSGLLHVIDKQIYDMLDTFDGTNDEETITALKARYDEGEMQEALADLHELIDTEQLFTPDIEIPLSFQEEPVVKSMCLHVAHDCNLRCQYCFAGTGEYGHGRSLMSFEVGKKAVDFIIEHSGTRKHCEIDFFGGEPLMNLDVVKQIVTYVRQRELETGKEFKLTLTTNGVLLSDEVIRYLDENNISMVYSLDGRKEVHDHMRPFPNGQGSFDVAQKNIGKAIFARDNKNYYLRGTYTANNLDFADDVVALADMGFKELSLEPVVSEDAPYRLREEHLPKIFAEYEKLTDIYLKRKLSGDPKLDFNFFHFHVALDGGPCVTKRLKGCGAGHEYYAVTPEGELYPCHQFVGREEYKLGTVFEGVKRTDLPEEFRQSHVLSKEKCRTCWARFHCSGGCHANADLFHHNLKEPYDMACEIEKKRLECALYIQAQLALAQNNG